MEPGPSSFFARLPRHTRVLALLCLLYAGSGYAATVTKINKGFFIASPDDDSPWLMSEVICAMHYGKRTACGRVVKIQGHSCLVKVLKRSGLVSLGDPVERFGQPRDVASQSLDSQREPETKMSQVQFSGELLGAGILYSIMGSYRFNEHLGLNFGFSFLSVSATATDTAGKSSSSTFSVVQFPVSVFYLLGGPKHYFEMLFGPDLAFATGKPSGTSTSGSLTSSTSSGAIPLELGLGYRLWPMGKGFHFRATAYGIYASSQFFPYIGVSFGYAF